MTYSNARGKAMYSTMQLEGSVQSANPHRLVQMLYEGALQRIAQARGHLSRHEVPQKCTQINKAIDIIQGLRMSLDPSVQADLVANLNDLYDFMVRQLMLANARNDDGMMAEVASLLRELKTAWDAIAPAPQAVSTPAFAVGA